MEIWWNMDNKPAYRYTVEYIRTGQPRPYADHEDVYRITIELRHWRPYKGYDAEFSFADDLTDEAVKSHIKKFCNWKDPPYKTMDDDFAPHLKYIKKIRPGTWEIFITTRFTD